MDARLRQVALIARDLEPVVADLCATFDVPIAFRDPGVGVFGLHNAVLPIGTDFLEVVSPLEPNCTAARYLARAGGDGGYMAIVQVPDLAIARTRLADAGMRIAWETTLPTMATLHIHPRDVEGAIVSLDWADPPSSWLWAGPDWSSLVRRTRVAGIRGLVVGGSDPERLAARWSVALGVPTSGRHIDLDGGRIVFEPGPDAPRIVAVDLAVTDRAAILDAARARGLVVEPNAVRIGGVRFTFTTASAA